MTNLDSILKRRNITLPRKVHLVKGMVFPVIMYGCESWTVKTAERPRVDDLNCGVEKTLESPLDFKEIQSVQSKRDQLWVLFGRNDAKAETPVLWPPHARVDSLEKTLMLGGIAGRRKTGQQRMRWLDGITKCYSLTLCLLNF